MYLTSPPPGLFDEFKFKKNSIIITMSIANMDILYTVVNIWGGSKKFKVVLR